MITAKLNITLHEKQLQILRHPAKIKVIKAGKRFGKTYLTIGAAAFLAGQHKNLMIWYVALTYRQAKDIAWAALKQIIPPEFIVRKSEQELTLELTSGSVIRLVGAENEDLLRGQKMDVVILDEADYMSKTIWPNIIYGQLLGSKLGQAYIISSPNRYGRNWFGKFWQDAKNKQLSGDERWAAFHFTVLDNPIYTKKELEDLEENVPADTWKVEYLGIDEGVNGLLVSEWDRAVHCRDFSDEHDKKLVRSVDWGMDHPTVCLWADVDVDCGIVYIKDEFYKSGYLISESCNEIKKRYSETEVQWTTIDPSTFKRNGQTKLTDIQEFSRNGVYCTPGDNTSRGYDILKMFFKSNMIFVSPKCKGLIHEIENYNRGEKNGDDGLDALRYMLVRIHDTYLGQMWKKHEVRKTRADMGHSKEMSMHKIFPRNQGAMKWVYDDIL